LLSALPHARWPRSAAAAPAAADAPAPASGARQQQPQQQQPHSAQPKGQVFLVGTGPGDPGLLTLRAVQLMQAADVVLYDRLVSHDVLRLVHPGARMVYVGKQAGYHTRTQVRMCV
jgi:hypothetical protein